MFLIYSDDDKEEDYDFFANFIGSLYDVMTVQFHEILRRFSTDKYKYWFIKRENVLFLGRFPLRIRDKRIVKELNHIAAKFLIRYPRDYLDNWGYSRRKFDGFSNELKTFKELYGDFIDSLWNHSTVN